MEYYNVKDFLKNCDLFTTREKQDIINEAINLEVNVINYINFEIETLKQARQIFFNQKNLI